MDNRSMCGVFVVFCLLMITVKGGTHGAESVSFSGTYFTMTCPGSNGVKWEGKEDESEANKQTLTKKYDDNDNNYRCAHKPDGENVKKMQFFVKAKVCDNCVELDGTTAAVALAVDIAVTSLVIVVIYICAKKQASGLTSEGTTKPKGYAAPPIPSPDYEQLNTRTRSQDTYSAVNRMG